MEYGNKKYIGYWITDSSMDTPEEKLEGATVLVDPDRSVTDGDMVLAEVNGVLVFRWYKKYGKHHKLVAANLEPQAMQVRTLDCIKGVVVNIS